MKVTGTEVLDMLCPTGGWIISGDSFEGTTWVDDRPRCTKKEFEEGFTKVAAFNAQQAIELAEKKSAAEAKLVALGLTEDDLKALGLG